MKIIAIIPARKGSKRLIGKNTKLLCGKPMIEYTIEEAMKSTYIDEIYITTDDEEVREIAKKHDITSFERSKELADDKTSNMRVLKYMVNQLNWITDKDIIILLQPTSPLRTAEDIDKCIEVYQTGDFSSVVTVRQSYPHRLMLNGAIYTLNKNMIMEEKRYDENSCFIPMPYEKSVDVDRKEDFEIAEMYMNKRLDCDNNC